MAEVSTGNRIKNIELLRFLFILLIVSLHINQVLFSMNLDLPFYNKFIECTSRTNMPVNFFFIMAGFFMFMKTDFTANFVDFAKKKLIRFMPVILVILAVTFVLKMVTPLDWVKHENLYTIFNIQNVGWTFENGNIAPSWFVSALFWTMCFYFYLYKSVKREIFNLITACLVFICYAIYLHFPDGYNVTNVYLFINQGMAQAFAGVGAGYFLNLAWQNSKEQIMTAKLSPVKLITISAIEIYCFSMIFYDLAFHHSKYPNNLYYILLFVILFVLFISRKGFLSKLFNNDISVFLGQFTYSIFISHYLIKDLWRIYVCEAHTDFILAHPALNLLIIYAVTILVGALVFYYVEKPLTKYLINRYASK